MDNNVTPIRQGTDFAVDMSTTPEHTTIAKPKLFRMESECRLLACLLEAGVENWDGYALALEAYRNEDTTIGGGSGS